MVSLTSPLISSILSLTISATFITLSLTSAAICTASSIISLTSSITSLVCDFLKQSTILLIFVDFLGLGVTTSSSDKFSCSYTIILLLVSSNEQRFFSLTWIISVFSFLLPEF